MSSAKDVVDHFWNNGSETFDNCEFIISKVFCGIPMVFFVYDLLLLLWDRTSAFIYESSDCSVTVFPLRFFSLLVSPTKPPTIIQTPVRCTPHSIPSIFAHICTHMPPPLPTDTSWFSNLTFPSTPAIAQRKVKVDTVLRFPAI